MTLSILWMSMHENRGCSRMLTDNVLYEVILYVLCEDEKNKVVNTKVGRSTFEGQ